MVAVPVSALAWPVRADSGGDGRSALLVAEAEQITAGAIRWCGARLWWWRRARTPTDASLASTRGLDQRERSSGVPGSQGIKPRNALAGRAGLRDGQAGRAAARGRRHSVHIGRFYDRQSTNRSTNCRQPMPRLPDSAPAPPAATQHAAHARVSPPTTDQVVVLTSNSVV